MVSYYMYAHIICVILTLHISLAKVGLVHFNLIDTGYLKLLQVTQI